MPRCLRSALVRLALAGLLLRALAAITNAQPLVINEIVSNNSTGRQDEDGDRPDWIELHNTFPTATSAAGYGLSDDIADPFKWRVPGFIVPAKGFLLVFADGKDRTNDITRLHANFSIQSAGERLFLTAPGGASVSVFPSRALPRDVALGRFPDGSSNLVYLAKPTPRSANAGPGYASIVRPPVFSFAGGFFENAFGVGLSSPEPGTAIRFTTDGSEPTVASPLYTGPLTLRDRSKDPNILSLIPGTAIANQHTDGWFPPSGLVSKSSVIRARAFRDGALPSEVSTRTWFVGTNSPTRFQLPVLSITTDTNGLFDYVKGIYVLGKLFDDYRAAHPTEALTGHTPANYQGRGPDWERPGHLEFFLPNGSLAFERDVSLEIQGQSSRSFRQKSLGARALGGDFPYEIFPGLHAHGTGQPMKSFSKVRIGNSGNDWTYTLLRDGYSHTLVKDLPIDGLAYRPAIVHLDGEFWGIHNLREQQDGSWIEAHYGVNRFEVALCEGPGALLEGRTGDESQFIALREYIRTNDLTKESVQRYVEARMDVDNFLLYHAIEIYLANADWPHNNIRYWRKRTATADDSAPPGHDGRWRWLLFDTDLSLAHPWTPGYTDNTLAAATNPSGRPGIDAAWSTVMLRQILKARRYRDRFANRMADLLNSNFREARAVGVLDELSSAIAPAMPEHIARWRTMDRSMTGWSNNVRVIRTFVSQRPANVRQQVSTYFSLGGFHLLNLDVQPAGSGRLEVNSLVIAPGTPGVDTNHPYPWRGYYFRSVPVEVRASPAPGWRFTGWDGHPEVTTNSIVLQLTALTDLVARFEAATIRILGWERSPGGALDLRFTGLPNATHVLQASQDLTNWEDIAAAMANGSGEGHIEVASPESALFTARFHRLVYR